VSHTHTLSYTVTTSCRPRDDVVSVISSFVPELSSLQTAELEMTIFNATVRAQGAGLDATWNDVFRGVQTPRSGRHRQPHKRAGYSTWTCWAASSAEARRQVGRRHVPSSMRPHVFEGLDTMSERLQGHAPQHRSSVHDVRVPQVQGAQLLVHGAPDPLCRRRDHHLLVLSHVLHTVDPGRVN
jgi:hypothetical protein